MKHTIIRYLLIGATALCLPAMSFAIDHTKFVGPDACVDCHSAEYDVWAESTHFKTYEELSLSDNAIAIAEALGIDDIEDPEGTCVGCHYTLAGESADEVEPIAGISCESCHGAAADWVDSHGQYPGEDADSESAEQKAQRIATAEAAGQIRPARIDKIASNCLSCHTVPNEELVNVGGHPAGSDFELVAWLEGEVRHNLFWSNGEENKESTPERKRVVYVVGIATDLEYSLRALAKSSKAGDYRTAMASRVNAATDQLKKVGGLAQIAAVKSMLSAAGSVNTAAPDASALRSAADKVGSAITGFAADQKGESLAALDPLIQGEGRYSEKY